MYLNNSTRVFSSNFDVTFKLILYRIIVFIVIVAFAAAILLPGLLPIIKDMSELGVFTMTQSFIEKAMSFTFDRSELATLNQSINELVRVVLNNHADKLTGTFVGVGALVLLSYVLCAMGDYPVGEMLNSSCRLQSKVLFGTVFITKFARVLKYALVKTLFFFPIDFALFLAVYSILVGVQGALAFFAVFIAFAVAIFGFSLRFTYVSNFLPTYLNEDYGVFKAFFTSLKTVSTKLGKICRTSLVLVIIAISLNMMIGLFTFGVGLIVSLPATIVMFKSLYFVSYYHIKGLRYYSEPDTVVNPIPVKERENSFKYDLRQD